MAQLIKACSNVGESDSSNTSQQNMSSCDVGRYSSSQTNNAFFDFATFTASIPEGSRIDSAYMRLAQVSGGYSLAINLDITARSGSWPSGGPTWASPLTQPSGSPTVNASLSGSGAGDRSFTITSLIQWLSDNRNTSHIFRVARDPNDTSGSNDAKRFSTTEANHELEINYTAPTAPGPPSSCSISPSIFEGTITITIGAGSAGTLNPITGYELERSINGAAFAYVKTFTGTSTTDVPTVTRGQSVRYRVRTKGTYAPLYSTTYATSGYADKNILPYAIAGTPTVNYTYRLFEETVRVSFTNPGNEDNLVGFQAGDTAGNVLASRAVNTATYVDVICNWAAGTSKALQIRGYDNCQGTNYGPWSADTAQVKVVTEATAPSTVTPANNGIYKDVVTVGWSGAGAGTGSTITGYRIRYRKVGDANYTYEDVASNVVSYEFNLATLGVARGSALEVGIMTLTASGYHSDYTASRYYYRNQLPAAPTNLGPAAGSYPTSVNLTWNAASDPDAGQTISYRLRVYQKAQGAGSFTLYETLTSATNSYSYPIGTKPIGEYYFLIDTKDNLGEYSATAPQTPTYKNNTAPAVPTIVFPKAGSTTRNPNPRIGVRFGADNENDHQIGTLEYNGVEYASNASTHWSTQGQVFDDTEQAIVQGFVQTASMSVRAKASDGNLASAYSAARAFYYAAVAVPAYQGTLITAAAITNLRTAINGVRDYFNLAAYAWTQPCVAGTTKIATGAAIVNELRTAVDQIITYINSFDSAGSTAKRVTPPVWISLGVPLNNLAFRQSLEQLWNVIATL